MMTSLGHEVFLYGGYDNEAWVKEFVSIVSYEDNKKWFGHYNWDRDVFGDWNQQSECWVTMNERASQEILKRKEPGDFIGLIAGVCQASIATSVPDLKFIEWGIGYEGIIKDGLHVFESNAWMHYIYGMYGIKDGRFFDAVIPNSFDQKDYIFKNKKDDYLLYLGRLTPRKGLEIVKTLAQRGHKIITAGQGDLRIPGCEHVGVVRGVEKAELLANAKALLAPTIYIEPFGGVAVEAMLSGTPAITPDFGAFTETIPRQFRCATLRDFELAIASICESACETVGKYAQRYLTKHVRHEYENYFKRVQTLDHKGWYDA